MTIKTNHSIYFIQSSVVKTFTKVATIITIATKRKFLIPNKLYDLRCVGGEVPGNMKAAKTYSSIFWILLSLFSL